MFDQSFLCFLDSFSVCSCLPFDESFSLDKSALSHLKCDSLRGKFKVVGECSLAYNFLELGWAGSLLLKGIPISTVYIDRK